MTGRPTRTGWIGTALLAGLASACRPADPGPILDPEVAYRKRTCYRCHGADLGGTEIGPPLAGLERYWTLEQLADYIRDPAPFHQSDPRIRGLVQAYNGRLMKGYPLDDAELRSLAAWLLRGGSR
jgi:cytochrome c553